MLHKLFGKKTPKPALKVDMEKVIRVVYANWQGKTSTRDIIIQSVEWGTNKWHPRPQWLLNCYDLDKKGNRTFALEMCNFLGAPYRESLDEQ